MGRGKAFMGRCEANRRINDGEIVAVELGCTFDFDQKEPLPEDLAQLASEYSGFDTIACVSSICTL